MEMEMLTSEEKKVIICRRNEVNRKIKFLESKGEFVEAEKFRKQVNLNSRNRTISSLKRIISQSN